MPAWPSTRLYGGLGTASDIGVGLGGPPPLPVSRYVQQVLDDQPISHYTLDDLNAALAADLMGRFNGTPTATGITYRSPGALAAGDYAMTLDGVAGKVQTPEMASGFAGASVSLEAWIKATATGGVVFNEISGGWQDTQIEVQTNGNVKFAVWPRTAIITFAGNVLDGAWHHLVLTYDRPSTIQAAYVDGQSVSAVIFGARSMPTDGHTTNTPPTSVTYGIGQTGAQNFGNGVYFNGSIDEVAIFGYALTANQVAKHYRLGRSAFPFPDMPKLAQPYIAHVYTNGLQLKKTLGTPAIRALVGDKPGLKMTLNAGYHPLVLAVGAEQPPANQVVDPGFEADDVLADVQVNWTIADPSEYALLSTATDMRSGRRGLKCTRTNLGPNSWNSCTSKRFAVVPGALYTASGWSKQNAGTRQTHMKLNWYDAAGNPLAGWFVFMGGTDGLKPWTYYTNNGIAPPNAVTADVSLMAGWWDGVTGTNTQSWFDDVRAVQGATTDDPVQNGDIIQLTEQGDNAGTVLFAGKVERLHDVVSPEQEIHEINVAPLVTELATYFNRQYPALGDVAQFVRDAIALTNHLRVQPETCSDTGVLAIWNFNGSNVGEALSVAKRLAGVNFWTFVDATGLVWFQSATPTNPARITLKRGFDYSSYEKTVSSDFLFNYIQAIGGWPTGAAAPITSTYNNLASQRKYGLQPLKPSPIYPTVTAQATLDKIVSTLAAALDRERTTYVIDCPALASRLSLPIPGGLTVRLFDSASDVVTQPMSGSGAWLGPFVVQDIETDGVQQRLITGDVPITSLDDLKPEINRIVQSLGLNQLAQQQFMSNP